MKGSVARNGTIPPSAHCIPQSLDAPARAAYDRWGWCIVRGFFAANEVDALCGWTDELTGLPEVPGRHMLYREVSALDHATRLVQRIENFCPFHAAFDRAIRHGRLRSAVESLMGERAVLFKEKINFKMAGGAGFEPHQDQQAGWSVYAPLFVTAMVALDDATLENGCLEFATMPRQTALIGREWSPLSASEMSTDLLQPVPTRAGDVVFFDSFVPHASKANRTTRQRRVLYLTFNAAAHGDHRATYFAAKRANFPPDVEREPGTLYTFRV